MKLLGLLFWEFFKTGLFAVGGGMATLPFLSAMGERFGWFSAAELADMLAISESTPGPIGINMATYVGYKLAGIPGGLIATLGLIAPSIIVILLIAAFLNNYSGNRFVMAGFYGLRPASVALIASAGLSVAAVTFLRAGAADFLTFFDWKAVALGAAVLVGTRLLKKLHPAVFIAFSAAVGALFHFAGC